MVAYDIVLMTSLENSTATVALYKHGRKRKLADDFVPGEYSVLCGRGSKCTKSSGNQRLKSLINSYLGPYSEAKNKVEKTSIVSAIILSVKQASPEGGAFVKYEDGAWWEVEDAFAREKIGCLFRDCLHTQYRSSTKAKMARKKATTMVVDPLSVSDHTGMSTRRMMVGTHQHHTTTSRGSVIQVGSTSSLQESAARQNNFNNILQNGLLGTTSKNASFSNVVGGGSLTSSTTSSSSGGITEAAARRTARSTRFPTLTRMRSAPTERTYRNSQMGAGGIAEFNSDPFSQESTFFVLPQRHPITTNQPTAPEFISQHSGAEQGYGIASQSTSIHSTPGTTTANYFNVDGNREGPHDFALPLRDCVPRPSTTTPPVVSNDSLVVAEGHTTRRIIDGVSDNHSSLLREACNIIRGDPHSTEDNIGSIVVMDDCRMEGELGLDDMSGIFEREGRGKTNTGSGFDESFAM